MQSSSLYAQLAETHGVVVYHAAALSPTKLHTVLNEYGKLSVVRTYQLQDDNYATIAFFAEPSSNASCYLSLTLLAQESSTFGLISVGWLHEGGKESFARQPYVKSRYVEVSDAPSASPSAAAAAPEGYLVAYWKGVAEGDRADVMLMAKRAATDIFEDEKEGGRSFFCFPSEDMADAFHSHVVSKHAAMRRCISYADATDFALAKKSTN